MQFFKRAKNTIREAMNRHPHRVKIGKRYVGETEPVFVIAEIGINHNGSLDIAKKLIDEAVRAGADAVKFQKRTTADILTKEGLIKPYNSPNAFAPTYGEHRDKLELSESEYRELKAYALERDILFFASVWDEKSVDMLERLGVDAYKIPSADAINLPLLEYVAKKDRPVLLSTGMSEMEEVAEAVRTIERFNSRIIIFHCLSLYPSPEEKINLRTMDSLREAFSGYPVGYSGHEIDLLPTLAAVSRGACIVERHFTLDKKMKGSDHAASLNPEEFAELVRSIRRIENILGSREKVMYDELAPLREKLAKSVASRYPIRKGEVITRKALTIKGPGSGIKPKDISKLVGKIAARDIEEDVLLPVDALKW